MGNVSPNIDTRLNPRVACSCGCGYGTEPEHLDPELAWLVERVRFEASRRLGREAEVVFHCWARCKEHNAQVRGAHPKSQHQGRPATSVKTGPISPSQAVDFHIEGIPHQDLFRMIARWHVGGLGLYSWGIHMDTGRRSRWGRGR